MKILISDNLSKQGVEILQKAGLAVDVKTKMSKDELLRDIKRYDGLIVRSATKVTAEVLAAASSMKTISLRLSRAARSAVPPSMSLTKSP
jgi:D-3-phosphoglycerate dehydrogenase